MGVDKFYSVFETQKLSNALESALKKKADITWIAIVMSIVSTSLALYKNIDQISSLNTNKSQIPMFLLFATFIIGLLLLISIVWFVKSIRLWFNNRHNSIDDLKKEIFSSEIKHEHNYVFILKKNIDSIPKLLFLKKSQWGFMLPYLKFEKELEEKEIEKEISKYFRGIKVNINRLEHLALSDVIKKKPEEGYMKFSYIFYHVIVHSNFLTFKQLIDSSSSLANYSFKALSELREELFTMKSNSDIVNYLAEENVFDSSEESFVDPTSKVLPSDLKVIWNITDKCSFDCKFCATNRDTIQNELTFDKRIDIAEELKKIEGVKIDFAGGDPLYDNESKKAIKHISSYMIKENITITSTGVGLSNIETEELFQFCSQFDISYDYPSTWQNDHRGATYNERNFEQIKRLLANGANVNILVTLSNHNTDSNIIRAMIRELKTINPNMITLLRLMPVGKQRYFEYPLTGIYNPTEAIKMFKDEFENKVKLHCAFRANIEKNNEECICTLLKNKVGIDNIGNMYACAWAGYLSIENENNPFYLGNILSEKIEKIFKSQRLETLKNIIESSDGKFCKIFSYLQKPSTESLIKNNDIFINKYDFKKIF
ncbi:MAG: radical SAM/SPASM domain-containing protein [Acidobacteria bacterium]|jgi:MoaA/NifB/PqqE/SkfB family radical SAM enzyme|nr:radical SAM/SPASM domain-containing protein [Acidobacteriota bacterium]